MLLRERNQKERDHFEGERERSVRERSFRERGRLIYMYIAFREFTSREGWFRERF